MAQYFATETVGALDGTNPPAQMAGRVVGAKLRRLRASINLASQAAITAADNVVLGDLPAGAQFAFGVLTCSATLGASAQIAIGTNPVHASNGQYRASAVSTAVETPALFGITTAQQLAPVASPTRVYLTNSTANLPASGIVNIDIFYSIAA